MELVMTDHIVPPSTSSERPTALNELDVAIRRWLYERPTWPKDRAEAARWKRLLVDAACSAFDETMSDIAIEGRADPVFLYESFWLYRLWTASGRLMYVGVTVNPRARIDAHQRTFGDMLHHSTWVEYETREESLDAEAAAIRDESPAFNHAHPYRATL
jgi:predicted GIY-YIG superfamily endonuclease